MVGKGLKTIRVELASFEMICWNPRHPHAINEEFQRNGTCRGLRNLSKEVSACIVSYCDPVWLFTNAAFTPEPGDTVIKKPPCPIPSPTLIGSSSQKPPSLDKTNPTHFPKAERTTTDPQSKSATYSPKPRLHVRLHAVDGSKHTDLRILVVLW